MNRALKVMFVRERMIKRVRLLVATVVISMVTGVIGPIGTAWAVDLCRCVDHDCRKQVCLRPW